MKLKQPETFEEDNICRIDFCEVVIDESSFSLHSRRHNSSTNSAILVEKKKRRRTLCTQYLQELNVWVGFPSKHRVGPFFISESEILRCLVLTTQHSTFYSLTPTSKIGTHY